MTRKSQLFRDLTYEPNVEATLSPELRAAIEAIKTKASPARFPAEAVAGALALASKGAARNQRSEP